MKSRATLLLLLPVVLVSLVLTAQAKIEEGPPEWNDVQPGRARRPHHIPLSQLREMEKVWDQQARRGHWAQMILQEMADRQYSTLHALARTTNNVDAAAALTSIFLEKPFTPGTYEAEMQQVMLTEGSPTVRYAIANRTSYYRVQPVVCADLFLAL